MPCVLLFRALYHSLPNPHICIKIMTLVQSSIKIVTLEQSSGIMVPVALRDVSSHGSDQLGGVHAREQMVTVDTPQRAPEIGFVLR